MAIKTMLYRMTDQINDKQGILVGYLEDGVEFDFPVETSIFSSTSPASTNFRNVGDMGCVIEFKISELMDWGWNDWLNDNMGDTHCGWKLVIYNNDYTVDELIIVRGSISIHGTRFDPDIYGNINPVMKLISVPNYRGDSEWSFNKYSDIDYNSIKIEDIETTLVPQSIASQINQLWDDWE